MKSGFALNQEVKSNYYYPLNESTDYSKFYASLNLGVGFNCFISEQTAIYFNYEVYVLGNDRDNTDWLEFVPNSPNNNLLNIGIKHNLKLKQRKKS